MNADGLELLKRVVQFVFHKNIVTAYHNCATSSKVSVEEEKRKKKRLVHVESHVDGSNSLETKKNRKTRNLLQELWQYRSPSTSVLFEC